MTQKQELVSCYEEDNQDRAVSSRTSVGEVQLAFISWLDDEMGRGHVTYYVGKAAGNLLTLLRVHDDQVPNELLIEALQTVTAAQRQGLAGQMLAEVVRTVPGRYCADVEKTNFASQATFARAGFAKTECPTSNIERWHLDSTSD